MWLQLLVELWFYNTGVCVDNIKFFVQLDCTDFYDFKWHARVFHISATTALVPFQIKYDIVHVYSALSIMRRWE